MQISIVEYVVEKLQADRQKWPEIAAATGVSIRTLEKIGREETKDPRVKTIEPIWHYFRNHRCDSR